MEITLADALSLLRKWKDEPRVVSVQVRRLLPIAVEPAAPAPEVHGLGRVCCVVDETAHIACVEGLAGFEIPLHEATHLFYFDDRELTYESPEAEASYRELAQKFQVEKAIEAYLSILIERHGRNFAIAIYAYDAAIGSSALKPVREQTA